MTGHENAIVLCIYSNYKEQAAQTLPNLIGALMKQCIQTSGRVSPLMQSLYDSRKGEARETHAFLQDLTRVLSSELQIFSTAYIIIDALDECSHEHALIECLSGLPVQAKLMFTSRTTYPSWFEVDSKISVSASGGDIQSYVAHRTQELRPLKAKDKDATKQAVITEISNQVVEQSRGM
jgi:hypothetical protein